MATSVRVSTCSDTVITQIKMARPRPIDSATDTDRARSRCRHTPLQTNTHPSMTRSPQVEAVNRAADSANATTVRSGRCLTQRSGPPLHRHGRPFSPDPHASRPRRWTDIISNVARHGGPGRRDPVVESIVDIPTHLERSIGSDSHRSQRALLGRPARTLRRRASIPDPPIGLDETRCAVRRPPPPPRAVTHRVAHRGPKSVPGFRETPGRTVGAEGLEPPTSSL